MVNIKILNPEPENDKDLYRKNALFPVCQFAYCIRDSFLDHEQIGKNLHRKRLYFNVRCNLKT